jgi:2-C-methyl-D-erythritol 4-phosphate cytidylyltransferase/2-C-methyl-D-erythritol 2,4-cyclodiphosphate synthase
MRQRIQHCFRGDGRLDVDTLAGLFFKSSHVHNAYILGITLKAYNIGIITNQARLSANILHCDKVREWRWRETHLTATIPKIAPGFWFDSLASSWLTHLDLTVIGMSKGEMRIAALIVAGGSGSRAGGDVPKQYASLGGAPVLTRTLSTFFTHPRVSAVMTVIRREDSDLYAAAAETALRSVATGGETPAAELLAPVHGGLTRQQSVLSGLRALTAYNPSVVLIHDAARPFAGPRVIDGVIDALTKADGAIAAAPVVDTLKRTRDGLICETIDRTGLWGAQTPQAFRYEQILAAHEAVERAGLSQFSDDASIAEWHGLRVGLVESSAENWKITTADDLLRAERAMTWETRVGTGFDVHAFEPGEFVTLCGVRIAHTHKLNGHSDADAPLHALTDALLGAIGAGDIGDHFPPSDNRWKGADSAIFLRHACSLVEARGGRVINVDVTILAERPKIAPHRDGMRARIAEIVGVCADRVGLKATTMETLGFIGRREGLAAMASATVALPAGRRP